jgi:hypothetical protein
MIISSFESKFNLDWAPVSVHYQAVIDRHRTILNRRVLWSGLKQALDWIVKRQVRQHEKSGGDYFPKNRISNPRTEPEPYTSTRTGRERKENEKSDATPGKQNAVILWVRGDNLRLQQPALSRKKLRLMHGGYSIRIVEKVESNPGSAFPRTMTRLSPDGSARVRY